MHVHTSHVRSLVLHVQALGMVSSSVRKSDDQNHVFETLEVPSPTRFAEMDVLEIRIEACYGDILHVPLYLISMYIGLALNS